jgi:Subtilase family
VHTSTSNDAYAIASSPDAVVRSPFAARALLTVGFMVACLAVSLSPAAHGASATETATLHTRALSGSVPARHVSSVVSTRSTLAARKATSLAGVPIAIVDTGVTVIPGLTGRVTGGTDLTGAGATTDGNGHGTAMASIAGGNGNGVCQVCTIIPVRAVGNAGVGTTQLAAQGVTWAAAHGARVINLSLTTTGDDPVLTEAIEDAFTAGVVVVVAAGNSGSTDPSAEGYPGAGAPDAISVASSNGLTGLFSWSNFGSWVQLAAPGSLTASTTTGRAFTALGTSASAAYISGVVGLMLSCNPALNPTQIRSILLGTGTPVTALGPSGRIVNATAAVAAASPAQACQAAAQAAATAG